MIFLIKEICISAMKGHWGSNFIYLLIYFLTALLFFVLLQIVAVDIFAVETGIASLKPGDVMGPMTARMTLMRLAAVSGEGGLSLSLSWFLGMISAMPMGIEPVPFEHCMIEKRTDDIYPCFIPFQ